MYIYIYIISPIPPVANPSSIDDPNGAWHGHGDVAVQALSGPTCPVSWPTSARGPGISA